MRRSHTLVFFDGHCGLCHGAVKFLMRRDPSGALFRFAPLQGTTFGRELGSQATADRQDTVLVLQTSDDLLERSDALVGLLEEIGGGWRRLGLAISIVPRFLRDLVYRFVAVTRRFVAPRPANVCPTVPSSLRDRFLP